MYAIIQDGSHQYKVEKGQVIWFEAKDGKKAGDKIEFQVLLLRNDKEIKVGQPVVAGARVVGEVVEQTRGEKIRVFKYRKRESYRRTQGHRQNYTAIKILDILPS
jgi:large subunit ribosomal protein L21